VPSAAQATDGIVVLGRVLAPYGVKGWLRVRPYTAARDALLAHPVWRVRLPGQSAWREVALVAGKVHADAVVAQLADVGTREAALGLRGAEIGVPRGELPEPAADEVYLGDLVGFDVVNRAGAALGRVVAVEDFGAHPVLRVRPAGSAARSERLIPLVPAHVDLVDLAARRIDVDWGEDY
jgi:16S rRNA processing protein RimM